MFEFESTGRKRPMKEKESRNRNLFRVSGLVLSVFKGATAQTFHFFSLTEQPKFLKPETESTDLILKAFQNLSVW